MSSTSRPIPGQRVSESLTQGPTREGSPSPLRAIPYGDEEGGRGLSEAAWSHILAPLRPSWVSSTLGLAVPHPLPASVEQEGGQWLWDVLSDPLLHQELVFDLGDPVRWEYLLVGTNKPFLSLTEEEDEGMNDDDDVEKLVSLRGVGGLDTLSCFRPA